MTEQDSTTQPYKRVWFRPDYGRTAAALKTLRAYAQRNPGVISEDAINSTVAMVTGAFNLDFAQASAVNPTAYDNDSFDAEVFLASTQLPPPPLPAEVAKLVSVLARTRQLKGNAYAGKSDGQQEVIDVLMGDLGAVFSDVTGFSPERWEQDAMKRPGSSAAVAPQPQGYDEDDDDTDEDDDE